MKKEKMDSSPKATVYRAFGDRTLLERDSNVGYQLPRDLFREWWLTWFWEAGELLDQVDPEVAGLSLHFMAAMVEAGDA